MTPWYWGLINALLVSLVIVVNGHGYRIGWAIGVLAQLWIIAFGLFNHAGTFVFSALPALMFAYNWWQHPRREARRKEEDRRGGDRAR